MSSDADLTSHAPGWELGGIHDGLVVPLSFYEVAADLSGSTPDIGKHKNFFKVQDVTVPAGTYTDCIVMWYLENRSYKTIDYHGKDTELGLATPTSAETGGWALDDFSVFAKGVGLIASGDINAHTGHMEDLKLLKARHLP